MTGKKIFCDLFLIGNYKRKKYNVKESILANIILKFNNKYNFSRKTELVIDKEDLDKFLLMPVTLLIIINHDNIYILNFKVVNQHKIINNNKVILAKRSHYKDKWPNYVKCGWKNLFMELEKIIKKSNFL